MNISKILGKKNNTKKLDVIVQIVAEARAKYNNEESVIDAPKVATCTGAASIKYMADEDKAAVATKELQTILCEVNALDENMQGVNPSRELTSLIATNPVLTNLEASLSLGLE